MALDNLMYFYKKYILCDNLEGRFNILIDYLTLEEQMCEIFEIDLTVAELLDIWEIQDFMEEYNDFIIMQFKMLLRLLGDD